MFLTTLVRCLGRNRARESTWFHPLTVRVRFRGGVHKSSHGHLRTWRPSEKSRQTLFDTKRVPNRHVRFTWFLPKIRSQGLPEFRKDMITRQKPSLTPNAASLWSFLGFRDQGEEDHEMNCQVLHFVTLLEFCDRTYSRRA